MRVYCMALHTQSMTITTTLRQHMFCLAAVDFGGKGRIEEGKNEYK